MAQDMSKFIIGIVIVGITLVIGIYIAASMQDSFDNENAAGSKVNESGYLNKTVYTLVDSTTKSGFKSPVIVQVINSTDNVVITSSNWTLSGNTLTNGTGGIGWSGVKITYSYTYTNDTVSSQSAADLITALSGGSAWITILVVVGFAVIVLGMLSQGLGKASEGAGGGEPAYTY